MKIKVTVLRREFNKDLADKYCKNPVTACSRFSDGQEFVLETMDQPAGFCYWAWQDVYPVVFALGRGGDFGQWMKDPASNIACCSDGIRPVIFEIRRLD